MRERSLDTVRAIGVDEIQYGRGHQYLTLVYQIEAGCQRLLWVGNERTTESFQHFFTLIGKELSEKIEFVCSDMWKPYLELIKKHCTNAPNILDRFHVVAKMNLALDDVRAAEARRMAQEGYEPLLKRSRWCLLKRPENLTDWQRLKLRDLVRYNLASVRAYLLKEEFQQLWHYDSPTWAGKFLDEWCTQTMRSKIEPMKKFARTVRSHRELLLNYFRARKQFSSGVIEGLNNKAKVTMRKAYGFRTFRATELALYHARVFTFRGKPIRQANTKAWHKALKRAGIENFRWHDLRHTWASWLVQHGTPLNAVQEMGAWESEGMVRRYAHLAPGHLAPHAEIVANLLGGTSAAQPDDESKLTTC